MQWDTEVVLHMIQQHVVDVQRTIFASHTQCPDSTGDTLESVTSSFTFAWDCSSGHVSQTILQLQLQL